MEEHYSHTIWTVKPGAEEEFVRRWMEFADWSEAEGLTGSARLFRDVDAPRRFVSFGPWESLDAIRRWRTLPGFKEHVGRLGEVLEQFEAHTLEQAAEHGDAPEP
jgi:heme-degrading monooxygenase HmoA